MCTERTVVGYRQERMAEMGGGEVARMHAVLFRYDALAENAPAELRRLVFDQPPHRGDTVLVIDRAGPRLVVFDPSHRPRARAWIVAVVRVAVGLIAVFLDVV